MNILKRFLGGIKTSSTIQKITKENWHTLSIEKIFDLIKSTNEGISHEEAKHRIIRFGKNELPESEREPAWRLFFSQFNSPLMYIMMVATLVSYLTGHKSDTIFIAVVAVSNVLVGFYQEHKANKSLESLKNLIKLKARIIRADLEQEVEVSQIVPGDIVVLRAGDRIPADGRIIECSGFKTNEASLTGESKPVDKNILPVSLNSELADRFCMVFMGTLVEEGSAKAVVVETGINTEYGDIVALLQDTTEEITPLQKTISSLSKIIGIFITGVVGLIALQGFIAGRPTQEILSTSLALFVSAIPEGLLPAITIVLTIGMRRILKYKGLVRRLAATETLGGVTVICTDKTGTLTEGKMIVNKIIGLSHKQDEILRLALLPIDAYIENENGPIERMIFRGRPTERALLMAGAKAGILKSKLEDTYESIDTIFFSSERKYSASLRKVEGGYELSLIGAPERVFEWVKNGESLLEAKKELDLLIKEGFRVLASAYKFFPFDQKPEGNLEENIKDLTIAGLIAFDDPVREDVAEAFEQTRQAGIRTIIITGDHKATAQKVASKIGFTILDNEIIEGHELEKMNDIELSKKIQTVSLFARVSPRHKLRIVKLLQAQGNVVAMFGDGVNDAPALKAADIGVAVQSEVDAAREVADIVLLDGSFATIVRAIEQGRIIFGNIRRVFLYLITQDFSQFFLFLLSIALGLPLPFLPAQLLLVNLVESGLPDLALTTEEEKDGVMQKPPRNPKESIVNKSSKHWMVYVFASSGGIAILLYYLLFNVEQNLMLTRTMMTAFFCVESLLLALSLRSFTKPILRTSVFNNKWITGAVIISFIGLLLAIYVGPFARTISLVALPLYAWAILLSANFLEILLIDHFKLKFLK